MARVPAAGTVPPDGRCGRIRKTDRSGRSAGPIRQADRPTPHPPAGAPRVAWVRSFVALAAFYRPPYSSRFRQLASRETLTHLLRRIDAERCEPGGENSNNAMHQGKARQCDFSIILHNEA